jgi:hypothetical protein
MYVVFISAIFGFLVTTFIVNVSLNQFPAKDLEYRTKSSQKLESDTTLIRESSTMLKARIEKFCGPYLPGQSANLIYHYNPSLLVWSMAIYILLTFSFATFPVGLLYLFSLRNSLKITSRQMLSALLAALSVVTLSILMNLFGNGLLNAQDVVRIFMCYLNHILYCSM